MPDLPHVSGAQVRQWSVVAGAIAVLLHLGVHRVILYPQLAFNVDMGRAFGRTLDLVETGTLPEKGPPMTDASFSLGPAVYVVLAPMVLISSDPLFLALAFIGLSGAALALFAAALHRLLHPATLALCLVWLTSSGLWSESQQMPWHPSLLPVVVAAWLWAARQVLERRRRSGALVLTVAAALAVLLHVTLGSADGATTCQLTGGWRGP